MATFIVLANFTDQGLKNAKETTKRAEAIQEAAKKYGVTMKEVFWTLGQYDLVATLEAPDDATITTFGLAVGSQGNVRTQTLRAFNREEMNKILGKL